MWMWTWPCILSSCKELGLCPVLLKLFWTALTCGYHCLLRFLPWSFSGINIWRSWLTSWRCGVLYIFRKGLWRLEVVCPGSWKSADIVGSVTCRRENYTFEDLFKQYLRIKIPIMLGPWFSPFMFETYFCVMLEFLIVHQGIKRWMLFLKTSFRKLKNLSICLFTIWYVTV